MADLKISQLTSSTTPLAGTEVLPIVQSGVTKQVSVANLTAGRPVSASTVTATTTIGVGAATPAASGAGITFPATQSPSTDVNTLDDYEEGAWTPSVGGNATYTLQDGRYVKIGKLVNVSGKLIINVLGTGSQSTISGLPFTQESTSNGLTGTGSPSYWDGFNVNAIAVNTNCVNNTTTFYTVITNAAGTGVTYNQPNFLKDGARIDFSFSYIASQ